MCGVHHRHVNIIYIRDVGIVMIHHRRRPSTTPRPGILPLSFIARRMNLSRPLPAEPADSRAPIAGGSALPTPRTEGRRWTVLSLVLGLP